MKELDDITGAIVDAALKIHIELGLGLFESVYESVSARALKRRGLQVERQKIIWFEYDGMVFDEGFTNRGRRDRGAQIRRKAGSGPRQAGPDLSPPHGSFRWPAHQFWRYDFERRPPAHCEPATKLRISAPPRESRIAMTAPYQLVQQEINGARRDGHRRCYAQVWLSATETT